MGPGNVKLRRHHRTNTDVDKVYPTSTSEGGKISVFQRQRRAKQRRPALNQTLLVVDMSFSPMFNTPPTLPSKTSGPPVSAFTAASLGRALGVGGGWGEGEGHY